MINKKFYVLFMLLTFLFSSIAYCESNFVSITNGGGAGETNTVSLGQSIVFAQKGQDIIAKSGYPSILMTSKSDQIIFTNKTENKTFESQVVPIRINITTKKGIINKIVYKVGNGEDPDFNKITSIEYTDFTQAAVVEFAKNISFTEGKSQNKFKIWAQYYNSEDGTYDDSWSDSITINTEGISSDVVIESPDPLTRLSSLDPKIITSKFSIDLSTVTVSLYRGTSVAGNKLYSVSASSSTDEYNIFDSSNSCVSYLNSDIIKKYNQLNGTSAQTTLSPDTEYTLYFEFSNAVLYPPITFIFKAMGGGVADILTYPSPFNPKKEKIKIRYILAKDSRVTIKLYNKAGKIIKKLEQSVYQSAGTNEVEWDGRSYAGETLATGVYICEIIANSSDGEHRRYTALAIVGR